MDNDMLVILETKLCNITKGVHNGYDWLVGYCYVVIFSICELLRLARLRYFTKQKNLMTLKKTFLRQISLYVRSP